MALNNQKILFKQGTQAALEQLTAANIVEGAFYLTNDTYRLYVGQDGAVHPISDSVYFAANVNAVPGVVSGTAKEGQIYYAKAENILMVYDPNKEGGAGWVQINPDTNTTVSSEAFSVTTASGVATVGHTITDSADSTTTAAEFTITGDGDISVSSEGNAITIKDAGYSLETTTDLNNHVSIALTNKNSAATNPEYLPERIGIVGTSSNVSVTKTENDEIGISVSAVNLEEAGTGISVDDQGVFTLTIAQDNETNLTGSLTVDPIIKVGGENSDDAVATATVHFLNGEATLPVYTKGEVDDKFKVANALVMKGSLGSNTTELPSSGVAIGDTYIVTGDFTIGTQTYHVGDLVIATGTEGDNGLIPDKAVSWIYVPSGDETIYQYAGSSSYSDGTYALSLIDSIDNDAVATFGVKAGSLMAVEGEEQMGLSTQVVTINHANVTRADSTGTATSQAAKGSLTIPAVTAVTTDSSGHITGVETTSYTVTDTNAEVDEFTSSVAAANNVATVTNSINLKNGEDASTAVTNAVKVSSSSLTVDVSGTDTVTVDMVWGSF